MHIPLPGTGAGKTKLRKNRKRGGRLRTPETLESRRVLAAPQAVPDDLFVNQDTALTFNPLLNDTDPDGDPLTLLEVTQADSGASVTAQGNEVTYEPTAGFTGSDSFTYTVSDGTGEQDTGFVNVTVVEPSLPPNARDDVVAMDLGETELEIYVLNNDSEPEGQPMSIFTLTQPLRGTATRSGDRQFIIYRPEPGFSGVDLFTYTVADSVGSVATATVTVNVGNEGNGSPVANQDEFTGFANLEHTINLLANDSDPDDDPISLVSFTQPDVGEVFDAFDGSSVNYSAPDGFTGQVTFSYTIEDIFGGEATANVTLTITPSNPPVARNDTAVTEGETIEIDVLANDTDPDAEIDGGLANLSVSSVGGATQGTVTINVDNTLSYTPDPGASGTDTFSYTVTDSTNAASSAEVTIFFGAQELAVTGVTVNGGLEDPPNLPDLPQPSSWTMQRSQVKRVQVEFDGPISGITPQDLVFTNLGIDAPEEADDPIDLSDTLIASLLIDGNVLNIDFVRGALQDGVYRLEVLPSAGIAQSFVYEGNADNRFYQMAADWNGDGSATVFDVSVLAYWFGQPVPVAPEYADCNGDNGVSIFDITCLAGNFGNGIVFPAAARPLLVNPPTAESESTSDDNRSNEVGQRVLLRDAPMQIFDVARRDSNDVRLSSLETAELESDATEILLKDQLFTELFGS